MSADSSRSQLLAELRHTLEEVARLSEMIVVMRTSHALDERRLKELSDEWSAASLRASELHSEMQALDETS
jgi:ABC-type sugar transport system ATPase subunit